MAKYTDKIIYMEGIIVEVHDGAVGIDLKVGFNMSFIEQLSPDVNEKYISNIQKRQEP